MLFRLCWTLRCILYFSNHLTIIWFSFENDYFSLLKQSSILESYEKARHVIYLINRLNFSVSYYFIKPFFFTLQYIDFKGKNAFLVLQKKKGIYFIAFKGFWGWSVCVIYNIFIYLHFYLFTIRIMARMLEGCRIWVRWGKGYAFRLRVAPRVIYQWGGGGWWQRPLTPDACCL